MKKNTKSSAKAQIVTLLSVIATAVAFAFGGAAMMLTHKDTKATFQLDEVLLSPQTLIELAKPKQLTDHFDYRGIVGSGQNYERKPFEMGAYKKFYQLVEGDISLEVVPQDVKNLFTSQLPARITLSLGKVNGNANLEASPLQTVEFAREGDYYRVQLLQGPIKSEDNWGYFFHPGLRSLLHKLFVPTDNKVNP